MNVCSWLLSLTISSSESLTRPGSTRRSTTSPRHAVTPPKSNAYTIPQPATRLDLPAHLFLDGLGLVATSPPLLSGPGDDRLYGSCAEYQVRERSRKRGQQAKVTYMKHVDSFPS